MPFFSRAVLFFFSLFKLYPLVKKNKRMCQKSETWYLRSICEETDIMSIVFSDLNLSGVYLDLWIREAL